MEDGENAMMNCVLLADRHRELSEGMRGLLGMRFPRVFMVADEGSLLEGAARLQPTLVVADLSLASGDLIGFLGALRRQAPEAKVILISVHDESTVIAAALAAGADGDRAHAHGRHRPAGCGRRDSRRQALRLVHHPLTDAVRNIPRPIHP